MKPTLYLLCGLPGSGKTSYAKKLESEGALRLTPDEEVFKRHDRNFSSEKLDEYEQEVKTDFKKLLVEKVGAGQSVVLDYGFWKKSERDEYKQLAESLGAECKLLFFDVDIEILKSRLVERNQTSEEGNHIISSEMLEAFVSKFEAPHNEGEEVVRVQN